MHPLEGLRTAGHRVAAIRFLVGSLSAPRFSGDIKPSSTLLPYAVGTGEA